MSRRYEFFLTALKKNEVFFIDEEYVIFYELDPENIFNDKRIIQHKSHIWAKHFDKLITSLSLFHQSLNIQIIFNKYKYKKDFVRFFYYIYNFNRKYLIKRNSFKRFYYHNILTFNFLNKKLNLTLRSKNKLISNISPGIITKKLGIDIKKYKKSSKITNIMIKSMLKTYRNNDNPHKLIIQIKGTKIHFYKIVDFCKEIIKKYTDAYIVYTPNITNSNYKFKKIRSLKKNFRKKYFKN